MARHNDTPVSNAIRSRVSIVFLPMPRGGLLITRCTAIESSGFEEAANDERYKGKDARVVYKWLSESERRK